MQEILWAAQADENQMLRDSSLPVNVPHSLCKESNKCTKSLFN